MCNQIVRALKSVGAALSHTLAFLSGVPKCTNLGTLENNTKCPRDVPLELARRTLRRVFRTVSYRTNTDCRRSDDSVPQEPWSVPIICTASGLGVANDVAK